jgi:hypothetical protein
MILAIFGVFALGTYLASSHTERLGLRGMVITVLGSSLSLITFGVSTFAATAEGQAYLAGIEEFAQLDPSFAVAAQGATFLLVILLLFVGNVLLGVAVWHSGILPKWAGSSGPPRACRCTRWVWCTQ